MSSRSRNALLLVSLLGVVCPACAQSPDMPAPRTESEALGRAVADAPNGVCHAGSQRIEHVGCVDEELAFSPDALEACRNSGARECDERCQKGDTPSCTSLALVHQLALETAPNTTYAARLFDKACAAGDGAACNDLGVLHGKGLGFPVDYDRAEALYTVACDRGSVIGCANLATSRTWGDHPPDAVGRAMLAVTDACVSAAQPRACAALGAMQSKGSGVPRDEKVAAGTLERGCTGGDASACEKLGQAYLEGEGVAPNDDLAMKLFRKACDSARSDACTDLATMYCMGRGMPRDVERSAALFRQACEAGDESACRAKGCSGAVAP
ncbi:MAG TPA: tetratricopeptide repeat protein [Polyangiaceae bacterium]